MPFHSFLLPAPPFPLSPFGVLSFYPFAFPPLSSPPCLPFALYFELGIDFGSLAALSCFGFSGATGAKQLGGGRGATLILPPPFLRSSLRQRKRRAREGRLGGNEGKREKKRTRELLKSELHVAVSFTERNDTRVG